MRLISGDKSINNLLGFHSKLASLSQIRFGYTEMYGEDVIALTKSKVDRLMKAYEE